MPSVAAPDTDSAKAMNEVDILIPKELGDKIRAKERVTYCMECGRRLCMYNYSVFCFAFIEKHRKYSIKVLAKISIECALFGGMKIRDKYITGMGHIREKHKEPEPIRMSDLMEEY